jgi:hypothetical protein
MPELVTPLLRHPRMAESLVHSSTVSVLSLLRFTSLISW